jgi:signal transduction histidine kinase
MSPLFIRLRIPVILTSLLVIVYFTVYVALIPHPGFDFSLLPGGEIEVLKIEPGSPAAMYLQERDRIIAIDGWPTVKNVDWRPLFAIKDSYELAIRRDSQMKTFVVPTFHNDLGTFQYRMLLHVIALATWIVGAMILLFATPTNRDAWRTGFVILGVAVSMAAISASVYAVPGGKTASAILLPVMGVGFARLALLPQTTTLPRLWRICFAVAYAGALIVAIFHLFELYALRPAGLRFYGLAGISFNSLSLLYGAVFLQANPVIAIGRYLRMPQSYVKQQLRVLMVCLLVGISPMMFLAVLPDIFWGDSQPFGQTVFEAALFFLILLPAGYGYVIYRHKYLKLDLFITQTLTILIVGLATLLLYSLFAAVIRNSPGLSAIEPLPSTLFVIAAVTLAPITSRSSLRATQAILYGRNTSYQHSLSRLTYTLSLNPEMGAVRRVLRELTEILQVRQAALFLADANGDWTSIEALQATAETITQAEAHEIIPTDIVTRAGLEQAELKHHVLLNRNSWAEVLSPIRGMDKVIGILLLGQRIPDGSFDAGQVTFIRQICDVIGVAANTIRLFEASLAMSRQLMQIRDSERTQLAAQIHDDPLQSISAVSNILGRVIQQIGPLAPDAIQTVQDANETLRGVSTQLREICAGLRPPVLSVGIEWVIKDAVYRLRNDSQAEVDVTINMPHDLVISDEATIAVYHILTESFHNIRKHSKANMVWVILEQGEGRLRLSVADNGCGTALDHQSLADLVRGHHFGIVGMCEWARLASGSLSITPRKGGGTVVTLTC